MLPGLIDMHGHLPPDNVLDLGGLFALLHLAHGVTSVRDAGDVDGTAVAAVRRGMAEGRYDGPRLFCAGMFITTGQPRWKNSIVMRSPDEAGAIAERLRSEGYHSMKLYENLTVEMIHALVDAAASVWSQGARPCPGPARLRGGAHARRAAPLRDTAAVLPAAGPPFQPRRRLGCRHSDAHAGDCRSRRDAPPGEYPNARRQREAARVPALCRRGATTRGTSCFPAYIERSCGTPRAAFRRIAGWTRTTSRACTTRSTRSDELVKMLFDAGARLHLGTDVQQPFIIPGAALIEEMRLFERAGIAPGSIWRLATRGAAEYLEVDDLGTRPCRRARRSRRVRTRSTVGLTELSTLRAVVSRGALYDKRPSTRASPASSASTRGSSSTMWSHCWRASRCGAPREVRALRARPAVPAQRIRGHQGHR